VLCTVAYGLGYFSCQSYPRFSVLYFLISLLPNTYIFRDASNIPLLPVCYLWLRSGNTNIIIRTLLSILYVISRRLLNSSVKSPWKKSLRKAAWLKVDSYQGLVCQGKVSERICSASLCIRVHPLSPRPSSRLHCRH
jgi:hypothetical protein